jgi:hypothetical protein
MALPAGYSYDDDGWIWDTDRYGPYSMSTGGVMTLLAGDLVSADPTNFFAGPNGFYYGSDASGPYARGAGGIYKLIG